MQLTKETFKSIFFHTGMMRNHPGIPQDFKVLAFPGMSTFQQNKARGIAFHLILELSPGLEVLGKGIDGGKSKVCSIHSDN